MSAGKTKREAGFERTWPITGSGSTAAQSLKHVPTCILGRLELRHDLRNFALVSGNAGVSYPRLAGSAEKIIRTLAVSLSLEGMNSLHNRVEIGWLAAIECCLYL